MFFKTKEVIRYDNNGDRYLLLVLISNLLPKRAKVGAEVTKTVSVKGNKRKITWTRTRKRSKNKNLSWKIKSNESA